MFRSFRISYITSGSMHLKRLEIQGFKSFANKTVLDFLPPKDGAFSITAIVGPNGAGKSNITDAVRWVMGEQSMKNVRAKKSEDVIFNGSETKGALSAAEVTMTLDNMGEKTGLDFSEIVITRRLYRSGESEYIVNNNPTRLLDIHLLLAKARFAEHAYSIISQGMIDRLLTVSPAERKDFFDEASGIKEHQIKQHQAILKLNRSDENIKQAEILLKEVEPHLKLLAKQVKKLEKRQEVEIELIATQEKYYFTLYFKNKGDIDEIEAELRRVDSQYRTSFAQLQTIQTELAELAQGSSRQDTFTAIQARYQEAQAAKNKLERELIILEGQLSAEYNQTGQKNISWIEEKITELKSAEQKVAAELTVLVAEAEKGAAAEAAGRKIVENLSLEQTQLKLKISRLQSQLFKGEAEQRYLEFSGMTAVKAVLESGRRLGKIHGLIAQLGDVAEEYRLALEVAAGSHLSSIVVEDEVVARRAIEYLRENKYGVATFMPLNKIQGRVAIFDIDRLRREKGVIGQARELIKYDPIFEPIFSFILGHTLVVEDLKVAERLGSIGSASSAGRRARLVTLAGDIIDQNGVMRGGYRTHRNNLSFSSKISLNQEDQVALAMAEVARIVHELAELERELAAAQARLVDLTVAAKSALHKLILVKEEREAVERDRAGLAAELNLLKASPEEYGEQLKKLAKEKIRLEKTILAHNGGIVEVETEIKNFNDKEEQKKQRVFSLQSEMQNKQAEVNNILSQRNDWHVQLAKVETKQENLAQEVMNDMKMSLQSIAERMGNVTVETLRATSLQEFAETIEKLKYQLSLIGGIDEEVVKEHGETKERYDFLSTQLADLRQASADLRRLIAELDEFMKKKREQAFKKIRQEFDRYFKVLFGGGMASLEEVYGEVEEENLPAEAVNSGEVATALVEDDGIEEKKRRREKVLTGIEVIANPPGKKVKYLNMLSGGERTLTSIALISAILYHNPSPFVILDEVEAALDEANTLRFAKIIAELSSHSQFIIVTHNRVTMHAANAIYGVVMGGDGVSKLLSVKLKEVPQYK